MIGVFDSGSGGLTVLRALRDRLPEQAFVYLGDHEGGPYGHRSADEVYALTLSGVERLFDHGCDLVILACNTAAAVALRRLQQEWLPARFPGRRVLGVFVPTVEAVTGIPWHQKHSSPAGGGPETEAEIAVGIFATPRTVASSAFVREIKARNPGVRVIQQACPDLADRIEADAPRSVIAGLIKHAATELLASAGPAQPDCFILGCTHYPLVIDLFLDALPAGAEVLEQPSIAADSLAGYLERHPEFSTLANQDTPTSFLTTGDPDKAGVHARRFFGRDVVFSKV